MKIINKKYLYVILIIEISKNEFKKMCEKYNK